MISEATLPLLLVLSPNLQPDSEAALERRVRRSLLRREPIVAGTAAAPYAPGSGSPLRMLLAEEGLEIVLTTASPRILRDLDLLVELDRRHSVAVRMAVPAWGTDDPEPRMRAVRGLAAEGIAASVLLQAAPDGRGGEEALRFLLEEAREAGAHDVEIDPGALRRGERARLLATFRRLRLEYGFPRGLAGRG
jgi:DNA repair photolyase